MDPHDPKPAYTLDDQANTDVVDHILSGGLGFDTDRQAFGLLATHCGYCDGELLSMSTFSVIRGREVEALCSPLVKQWMQEHHIEPINFDQYWTERRDLT